MRLTVPLILRIISILFCILAAILAALRGFAPDIACLQLYDLGLTNEYYPRTSPILRGLLNITTGQIVDFKPQNEVLQRELLSPDGQSIAYLSGPYGRGLGGQSLNIRAASRTNDGVRVEDGLVVSSEDPNAP